MILLFPCREPVGGVWVYVPDWELPWDSHKVCWTLVFGKLSNSTLHRKGSLKPFFIDNYNIIKVGDSDGPSVWWEVLLMKRNLLRDCKRHVGFGTPPGIITSSDSVMGLSEGEGQACLQPRVKAVTSHALRFNYRGEAPASSGSVSALLRHSTSSKCL